MTTERVYNHSHFQNIACPKLTNQIAVETWVRSDDEHAEVLHVLVSKWVIIELFEG